MPLMVFMQRTRDVIDQGLMTKLHVGAQVFITKNGETILDEAVGEASPGVPMTTDSLMIWLSSSKPVTAVAIAQLWERGKLKLDDPIAAHLLEFGRNGKEAITLRHALTHTGGFRGVASRWDALPWDATLAGICDVRIEPNWVPGRRAGYHIASSWYILAEIVQRLSGKPFSDYVRDEIFLPLGMNDCWIGMPAEQYAAYGDRLGVMHLTDGGTIRPHPLIDSLPATIAPRPGSNGRGPMRELARFYQMLLNGGSLDGVRVLSPQTVEAITARHRVGLLDQTFRLNVDWGLGLIVNTPNQDMQKFAYGFGPHASLRAFGHGGNQSSLGMADPENGLAVAIVFNGMPGEVAHAERMRSVTRAIYEDLAEKP